MVNFPDAIQKAVGVRIQLPCARPFTSIQLLHLMLYNHIEGYGLCNCKPVLTNPGHERDNLCYYVEKCGSDLGEELEKLVTNPECTKFYVHPMNVKPWAAMKAGFYSSISLQDRDLANVGFKTTSDENWILSFGNGLVEKRSVPVSELEQFLLRNSIKWNNVLTHFKGVIPAIYCVAAGGLKYTGDSYLVRAGGAHVEPTETPVEINSRWHYHVSTAGQVVLSEINPRDWIIGMEYQELE